MFLDTFLRLNSYEIFRSKREAQFTFWGSMIESEMSVNIPIEIFYFFSNNFSRTELKLESLEDAVVLEEPESDWLHDKRGCPAYVSPEILKAGATYSGKAADMWSLGVILYTMLAGRYPFSDLEHSLLFAKISRGHFVIPECLSSRARCLIRSLLRRDPSERITSEDILHHPWLAKEERDWTSRSCDQLVPESSMYDD
ncbi:hypothetical protein WA026_010607 [Henosepilachna vigintioctopunctata]|uniref:Protein kinase domain-containing protein n=1 Tax=Henosepilachna vigintioctopunctata TaxID=420089 RepID=A0AAW1V4B9_9CUCU